MDIEGVIDAIIDLVKKDLIAKTNLTADVSIGDTVIKVTNSFHFEVGQEIVLIDFGYNDPDSPHYNQFEYSVVKSVDDTRTITLQSPAKSDWLVSESSFIQKTIGHTPLYEDNVLYGDREVIPEDHIAITVDPVSLSNQWIYLQGGLDEESRVSIRIYGQSVETDEGMRILNRYTKAVYQLLNDNLHLNINDIQAPICCNVDVGDDTFCIEDTPENRENFTVSDNISGFYRFQDNQSPPCRWSCVTDVNIVGDKICLTLDTDFKTEYKTTEFAVAIRGKRYFYDSRVDSVTFGEVQKGSAVLRAAELSWFGKEVNEHGFPQYDKRVICFDEEEGCSSSSSFGT